MGSVLGSNQAASVSKVPLQRFASSLLRPLKCAVDTVDVHTCTQMITAACTRLNPVLTAQVKVGVVELNRRSSPVTSHTTPLSCLISQLKSALLNYFSRANNDSGSSIGELPHQSTEINPSRLLQVAVMRMLMTVSFVMRLYQHVAYPYMGLKGVRPHRI